MNFPSHIYLGAFLGSLLISFLSLPAWRKLALSKGWIDDPGERKIHTTSVPLAGGFAVFTGMFAVILSGLLALAFDLIPADTKAQMVRGFTQKGSQLLVILVASSGMLLLGWLDDLIELKAYQKFIGQLILAFFVAISGVRISLFIPSEILQIIFTTLWIIGITNAFNFLDNMNGLCTGIAAIAGFTFASIAAGQGHYGVATLGLIVSGALIGFLPFNFPKASTFLGDSGSHLVGFLVSIMAVLPHFYTGGNSGMLLVLQPLCILAVPLLDLLSVVIIRTRMGKPIYIGDNNHFSHRLVKRGCSKSHAVIVLWFFAALAAFLATRMR